ncbi:MAG: dihydroneopterin aldolase [Nanoarchaeota archaeon]
MLGKITIKELQYTLKIGVTEQERQQLQPLFIDLDLYLDITDAIQSQDITTTVNYSDVQKKIKKYLEEHESYILVERLCDDVATLVFSSFPLLYKVRCTCWKPSALSSAKNVGVTVVKKRK